MESLLITLTRIGMFDRPVIVIGTANVIENLDPALLRPGRFDEIYHVPEPDDEYLALVVKHYIRKFGVQMDVSEAVKAMSGFSPADVREVLLSVGTVGTDVFETEVERVRMQRSLYAGDACSKFLVGHDREIETTTEILMPKLSL